MTDSLDLRQQVVKQLLQTTLSKAITNRSLSTFLILSRYFVSWSLLPSSLFLLRFGHIFSAIISYSILVPADGVKGKTWGPSSGGQVLNSLGGQSGSSKSRPAIPEERWSKSASSLDKSSSRSKSGLPSVTSVPEIGKNYFESTVWKL